jgi:hypothetical protein
MTERLIDIWRSKTNSLTELAVREFLLAYRSKITIADAKGEKSIDLFQSFEEGRSLYRGLPEIKAEIEGLRGKRRKIGGQRPSMTALKPKTEIEISDGWFNDAFIEELASEGFVVKLHYIFKDKYEVSYLYNTRIPKEILLAMDAAQQGPIPMPSGGWTKYPKYENIANRHITLCWD